MNNIDSNIWHVYNNSHISDSSTIWAGYNASPLPLSFPVHIITASNPYEELLSDAENKQRNQDLLTELNQLTIKVKPVIGHSPNKDWQEESFAVSGLTREHACEIAEKYNQRGIFELNENELIVIEVATLEVKRTRPRSV